jgi:hypothetical protein
MKCVLAKVSSISLYVDQSLIILAVGICLPMAQWLKLKELLPDIDQAMESISSKKFQK